MVGHTNFLWNNTNSTDNNGEGFQGTLRCDAHCCDMHVVKMATRLLSYWSRRILFFFVGNIRVSASQSLWIVFAWFFFIIYICPAHVLKLVKLFFICFSFGLFACVVLSCSALTSRAIIIQCLKAWATIITVTWWSLHPSALSVEAPCSLLLWWCIERQHIKYWPHTHWAIVGLNIITWENVKIVCLKLTLGEKQITWGKWHIELLRSKQWAYGKNGRRLFTN